MSGRCSLTGFWMDSSKKLVWRDGRSESESKSEDDRFGLHWEGVQANRVWYRRSSRSVGHWLLLGTPLTLYLFPSIHPSEEGLIGDGTADVIPVPSNGEPAAKDEQRTVGSLHDQCQAPAPFNHLFHIISPQGCWKLEDFQMAAESSNCLTFITSYNGAYPFPVASPVAWTTRNADCSTFGLVLGHSSCEEPVPTPL